MTVKFFLILGTYVLSMLTGWGLVELVKRLEQPSEQLVLATYDLGSVWDLVRVERGRAVQLRLR
jgi:hypothetical protein